MDQHPVPTHSGSSRCAADFLEMPYTSALLLDAPFDASITHHPDFSRACRWGFDAYFTEMYEVLPSRVGRAEDLVFVEKRYTSVHVRKEVLGDMSGLGEGNSLAECVGMSLGWLSALELVQPQEASEGLGVLTELVAMLTTHDFCEGSVRRAR